MPCYKDKIEKEKNKFLTDIFQQRRIRQAQFLSSGYHSRDTNQSDFQYWYWYCYFQESNIDIDIARSIYCNILPKNLEKIGPFSYCLNILVEYYNIDIAPRQKPILILAISIYCWSIYWFVSLDERSVMVILVRWWVILIKIIQWISLLKTIKAPRIYQIWP